MKTLSRISILALAAAAAVPAAAAVRTATYTGTVYNAYDYTGVFGAVGDLSGATYVVKYRYDSSLGYRITVPGTVDYVYGGDVYSVPAPVLSATIKINGVTFDIGTPNYYGIAYTQPNSVAHVAQRYISDRDGYIYNYLYSTADVPGAPASLDAFVPPESFSGDYGYFQLSNYNYNTGETLSAAGYLSFYNGGTFSVTGGVPEPATWAMLIAGFGLVGATARRRRALAAA